MLAKHIFYLILLFPIFDLLQAEILAKENVRAHTKLANCALFVSKRYISLETNNLVIKEKCSTCMDVKWSSNQRLLDHYLQHFDGMMTLQLFLAKNDENPWNYYFFIVDDLTAFNEQRFNIPYNQYEREFYFLIALTHIPDNEHSCHQIMLEIFRTCVLLRVLHVVIMVTESNKADSIAFYTYMFSGNYFGQEIELVQVNRFHNNIRTLENDFLFPPKLLDFHGCTLNVTAFLVPPWIGFDGDQRNVEHTTDVRRLTGIEGDHFKLLAKILNFKVNLRFAKHYGEISLYGNSTGCFADLENNKADIAFGMLSAAFENFSKFSTSLPYRHCPYVFVVRSDLNFGLLEGLTIPFHRGAWLTIGLTILLALAFIKAINNCRNANLSGFLFGPKNHYPTTNLIMVLLGNPVVRPPLRNFARFLLMSWLLLTLILRSSYQGKLFDALRVSHREAIPKGITELIQQKYKLIGSIYVNYYPKNLTIINKDLEKQFVDIQSTKRKLAVVSSFESLGYYNFIYRNSSRLTYVPEQVLVQHLSFYFQRHSVLKLTFDTKIQQLISSGITQHSTVKQFERKEFQMMNVGSRKLPRISNERLKGLYSCYTILIGIATICFILEILSYKIEKFKRFFDQIHF